MKTYQEFVAEAKKCWPGYKKKGTKKLFGKTYNNCVKEGKVEWDNPKRPLQSGLTPREKNRAKRISTNVENPDRVSFGGKSFDISGKDYERYGKLKLAHDEQKGKKVSSAKIHKFNKLKWPDDTSLTRGQAIRKQKDHKNIKTKLNSKLYKNDERQKVYHMNDLKEPKESFEYELEEDWSNEYKRSIDCSNPKGFSQKAHCAARKKRAAGGETKSKSPFKEMYEIDEHCGCEDSAVKELESGLKKLKNTSYDSIDELMRPIMKKHDMTAKQLHNAFVDKHNKTPDDWIDNLNESSTGEKTRGRATLARGRGADMTKSERTTAAVAKKAGLKGTGKYSTKDLRKPARDYTTYDSEDTDDDYGSTKQDHFIRTYPSARAAAKGERLISKMKAAGRTSRGMTKLKTAPSSESVRRVKDLKKQMTKSGANKTGKVHTVDIMHRDSNVGKGDRNQQMERGRNFIQAIKDTPKHLKKAGAKKGDTVIGKPTAVMDGEDKKTGEAKRAKLYKNIFGKRSTEKSNKTGLMTGKV